MELIAKADVVLALGTRLNPFSTLPGYGIDYWPKNAKIIQVDINADRIGLTKPSRWRSAATPAGRAAIAGATFAARPATRVATSARRSSTRRSRRGCSSSPAWITRTTIRARHGTSARASAIPTACRRAWRGAPSRQDCRARRSSLRHRQQLRDRQRLSDVRSGPQYLAPGLFGPCGYGFRRSSAPRSAIPTRRWSASPATAPSAFQ